MAGARRSTRRADGQSPADLQRREGEGIDVEGMMDRIRDEMAHNSGNGMIQVIGDHLTAYLQLRPDTTFREGATIEGAIKKMSAEARKSAEGNMGALDFLTGMKIVYEEFGLDWDKKTCMQAQMSLYDGAAEIPVQTKIEMQAPADEFDLDAFLGGD